MPRPSPTPTFENLPAGVWKMPVRYWWVSMQKHDGHKDVFTVRGGLSDAYARREALFRTGRYQSAWIGEKLESKRSRNIRSAPRKPSVELTTTQKASFDRVLEKAAALGVKP